MSRISVLSFFLIVLLSNAYANGQVDPDAYRQAKSYLARLNPSDAGYKHAQFAAELLEEKMRSLFRSMPAVAPIAIRSAGTLATVSTPKEWRTKLELELRRSRIVVKSGRGVWVSLQISTGRSRTGQWSGHLRVTEFVTLSRPNRPTFSVTTYKSSSPYRKTQGEAEKDMWAALDEFCLLYMKFSKE